MKLPKIKASDEASLCVALSERALYIQNHKEKMHAADKILSDMNLFEVEKLTSKHDWNFFEFLFEFFKILGFKKEIKLLFEDDAEKILQIVRRGHDYK